jgi:FAD:protein FMN transferase
MSCYHSTLTAVVIMACIITSFTGGPDNRRIQIRGRAQGTTYSITYYASDTLVKKRQIDSLLNRIDQSLSIYQPTGVADKPL